MSSASQQIDQISRVLMDVQLENGQLNEDKRALEERVTEVEATLRALTKPKKRRGQQPPPPSPGGSDDEPDGEGEGGPGDGYRGPDPYQLGKGFAVSRQLFAVPNLPSYFKIPIVRPNLPPNDPKLFEKKDEKHCLLGALADLFDFVPVRFHDLFPSAHGFQNEFKRGFKDIRYSSVNRLRSNAGLIFGLKQALFQKGSPKTDPRVTRYLKFDPNSDKQPLFFPLAFPDCIEDYTVIFRSDIILSIIRCVLNGPSALAQDRTGGTLPTNHIIWGLKEVTPGLVAFGYTLGIFLCSTDREFHPVGKFSGINYHDCYWRAKKWIVKAADLPSMVETLRWFQQALFGATNLIRVTNNLQIEDDDDDILEACLRSLRDVNLGAVASRLDELVTFDLNTRFDAEIDIEDITEVSDFDEKTDEAAGEMTDGDEDLAVIVHSSSRSVVAANRQGVIVDGTSSGSSAAVASSSQPSSRASVAQAADPKPKPKGAKAKAKEVAQEDSDAAEPSEVTPAPRTFRNTAARNRT